MEHKKTLQPIIPVAVVFLLGCAAAASLGARVSIPEGPADVEQATVSNPEGRALLAKVIEALGGEEKVRAVKAVRAKVTSRENAPGGETKGETQTEVETIVFQPVSLWQKFVSPDGRGPTLVISPKAAFTTSFSEVHRANGPTTTEEITEEIPPSLKADRLRDLARDPIFVTQHAHDPNFIFHAGGPAKIGNVETRILDVSHPAGDVGYPAAAVRWFIDSEGRIVRATWEQSQADSLVEGEESRHGDMCLKTMEDYSDWRLVDGILFPFKEVDTCEDNGKTLESLEIKLIEVNPKVDPKILQWPGSTEKPSASNSEGKALLDQVIQALGGEAKVRSVKSIRVKGRSRVRGPSRNEQESESETLLLFPDWIWLRHPGPGRGEEMTIAASPKGVFLTMGNSEKKLTQEMPAWAREAALGEMGRDPARDDFICVAQHAGDPNYIFYGAGTAKIGGIETRILDVSTPLTDVRWFVDPQTGRILRASWKGNKSSRSDNTGVMVTDYADWKPVDGIWFPFLERTSVSPGKAEFTEFTAREIEVNSKVDLKIFEKPTYPAGELPELKALAGARSIRIQDNWGGLGPPRTAQYELHPGANGFTGQATFSVSDLHKTEGVQIPISAAKTFFRILGEASLEEREYVPRISHTDDYPSLQIELALENETVAFFTQSQGDRHVPWAVKIKGKTYVINSDAPARALAALDPYLKRDVLKKLYDERFPRKR